MAQDLSQRAPTASSATTEPTPLANAAAPASAGSLSVERIASSVDAVSGASSSRIGMSQTVYAACVPGLVQRSLVEPIRAAVLALSDEDYAQLTALERQAQSSEERGLILKSLAANHSIAELSTFAAAIHGKGIRWLYNFCTADRGVQQVYANSCAPTTEEMLRESLDPIFALALHAGNKNIAKADDNNPTAFNPLVAADQKQLLEAMDANGGQGVAVPRSSENGQGVSLDWIDEWSAKMGAAEGIGFTHVLDPDPATLLQLLREGLTAGMPMPLCIGNGPGVYGHAILASHIRPGKHGGHEYMLQDPWAGQTYWCGDQEIAQGRLNIAGWNMITMVEVPTRGARQPAAAQPKPAVEPLTARPAPATTAQ